VQKREFTLSKKTEEAKKFFQKLLDFDLEDMPLEYALLAVESLCNSLPKFEEYKEVLQKMFSKTCGGDNRSPALVIFQDFLTHSLDILERRFSRRKACADTTAMYLLTSVVQLIANCHIINTKEQMMVLKTQFGLDWEMSLIQVRTEKACASFSASLFRRLY
jgi:hypothetical protein